MTRTALTLVLLATTVAVAGCGHSRAASAPTRSTAATRPASTHAASAAPAAAPRTPAQRLGFPALKPGPVPGYLMVADRDNNRIIIINPHTKRIVWRFPRPGDLRPGQSFNDPDDAFFTPGYRAISTNEEFNQTIGEIDVRTHRLVWSFGHPGVRGSAFGYLSNPDDAYLLPNGLFMVADIQNCRVLFINRAHRVVRELGRAGNCGHNPPTGLSSPNGATPLPDGGVLVTEIGGWVDRISKSGRLLYTVRTPTSYPSDAQLLPNGNILVAGFDTPGRVDELTSSGRIVWTFAPTGYWSLDRPSLAVRWPNGMIAITDDWHHRVLVVNPHSKRVVWSYGHLDQPGSTPGYLNKPDGLDLLPAVPVATSRAAAPASAVPHFRHALVVVFENHERDAIVGNAAAPTFAALARRYATLSDYTAVAHPSLPNYLALVSGSTHGITSDCTSCVVHARSLADSLERSGSNWKTYAEGLPRPGFTGAASGLYAKKHDPFLYFADIADSPRRRANVVPLTQLQRDVAAGRLPRFALVIPNLCHDLHNCPLASGDRWLRKTIVPLLKKPQLAGSVIFVVFDEGTSDLGGGGRVAALALGPLVRPGSRFARPTSHYGLLRTLEDAWRLPRLGRSAQAQPITGIWR